MQPAAPALDIHLDLSQLEAAARKSATSARALVNRAVCDDQENALGVAAFQFDSAAKFLNRGDTDKARDALRAACSYAGCEEAAAPKLAAAARTLLNNLPA
ncbi:MULTISPECIES: hypothetical protein [unclassified Streptomyces]|uniref:hypothetical protein n=1 Tax=unclassified Streptomyces TaxID=2593676 RepID=UPI0029BB8763|nr:MULTISPECIES: hypothetical protein [unclassified Streptomyces]MDX3766449.1 hypothetical protein [Streptomyces sp. AK08-01B]MDX3816294.1 hypothetical protein [Streptomyces sp. AK08-01A]